MRFVRVAESFDEQNLMVIQEEDQLFYTAIKAIEPKQELKVWYSLPYAKRRGLAVLGNNEKGKSYKIRNK